MAVTEMRLAFYCHSGTVGDAERLSAPKRHITMALTKCKATDVCVWEDSRAANVVQSPWRCPVISKERAVP